jgi:DNA-binding response OmpR family regulator
MKPTSRSGPSIEPTRAPFDAARVPTVLIVDDDSTALKLADVNLGPAGFRVVCARSAEEGLSLAASDPPTVVVVDLLMPGADGFEFIERFRRESHGSHVPIVVWTVKDLTAQEHDRLQSFATAIVLKRDGGVKTLLMTLRQLLSIDSPSPAALQHRD